MEVNMRFFSFLAAALTEGERSGLYTGSLTMDFRNNTHNRRQTVHDGGGVVQSMVMRQEATCPSNRVAISGRGKKFCFFFKAGPNGL